MTAEKIWTKEKIKTIEQMFESGKTKQFVASHFEVSPDALAMVMSRNQIYVKKKQSGKQSQYEHDRKHGKDLATRLRILKGEELRKDTGFCYFTDDQLMRWKDNTWQCCDRFCKEVLHVELQDYQLDCIDKMLKHKRFVGILGRQSGKDFLLSCFVVWQSIINSNSKILLVSASQRASDLLYNRILGFIGQSNELFDSVDRSNMEKCLLKNNSEVWSLPATGLIRGFTEVTHIITNEAHEIPDDTFSAVEPMLAVKNGYLYIFSTPRGCIGRLWVAFNDPLFSKVQLPSTVNKHIPEDYFELQKQTMDSLEYDMEINAQFQESVDAFFKLSTIQKCSFEYDLRQTPNEFDRTFYCAIDWGRIADSTVITILSKKLVEGSERNPSYQYKVENIIELSKVPFSQQLTLILKLHKIYKFQNIMPEWNGLGIPPSEQLQEELGHIVQVFKPTIDNKEKGYNRIRKIMEDGDLVIPKSHIKLQYELRTFQYELTRTGKMKLFHLANSSDDFCDSLMMAVFIATKKFNMGYIAV